MDLINEIEDITGVGGYPLSELNDDDLDDSLE